ncbi:flagellar biosynthesis protein [Aquincola sp. S2]|uniref:Flagellar assembly protein FliH n=1 Tax=Pseudaquabacterium terrae TaxID=2732868 RepID=A0ABX2ENH8_9BURK|nr:flagellar assembly protein FliH [Aquabacterium terrae]NRF70201.1 flagellar biosynthesis protein [Aquabacterium terrae]
MSSSKSNNGPRQVPPPPNSRAGNNAYTRFIPREELQGFASWMPNTFGDNPTAQSSVRAAVPEPEPVSTESAAAIIQAQMHAARQDGYRDGYRDGLVALESFKQSFAQQLAGQFGLVLTNFDHELGALEQHIATSVSRIATQLARQVVRSELTARPELVVQVAIDAVNAVLMSARQITVYVHPEDQAMIAGGAGEVLAARGARLVSQPNIDRGGVLIESDAGTVDARISARWNQAVQALGTQVDWTPGDD